MVGTVGFEDQSLAGFEDDFSSEQDSLTTRLPPEARNQHVDLE